MSIQDRNQWIHECFAENYDILVVRAKRRAGNDPILRNEIEDCVIEAFEMAWSKYGQLKHHPCILGWLTQTVYNKIDNLRMHASTKMSRQAADIDDPAVMQIEDKRAQKRLEEWYEQQEQREKIEMILKMLSLNEKEIFEDYFMCEKSAREIQQANGGTLEGIRAAIRRIRKKARLVEQEKNYFVYFGYAFDHSSNYKVGRNSTWQLTKAQSFWKA